MLEKIKKNDTSFVTGVVAGDLIATDTPVSDPPPERTPNTHESI